MCHKWVEFLINPIFWQTWNKNLEQNLGMVFLGGYLKSWANIYIGHKLDKMGCGYHGHNMDKSWTWNSVTGF